MVSTNNANQNATFAITEIKVYVRVVTLSIQDNAKLLQQLKSRFKRTVSWNKYISKPELLRQNQQLNHLVEPNFRVPLQSLKLQISRLFRARSSLTFR